MGANSYKLSFEIAKTHLLSKKKQTIVAALGVTFGIAMFILMISFMTGVNKILEESALTATPHIHIFHDISIERESLADKLFKGASNFNVTYHQKPKDEKQNLKNGFLMVESIRKDPMVMGVSAQLSSQVFYNYGPIQFPGSISGVNIVDEDKLFNIRNKMREGALDDLLSSNDGIIIGSGLAKKMSLHKGDKITISTPKGLITKLNVVGIFRMGIGTIDNIKSYANISTVQKLLQKDTRYITDINIKLYDVNNATVQAALYERKFQYRAEDWATVNGPILLSFTLRNAITYVVVTTLLIVAGFGIYNIMNMTIYDKMKDIAILKATGFEGRDIIRIFMTQAVLIGVAGGLAGLLLGFLLSYGVSQIPFNGGDVLDIDRFPVMFAVKHYVYGILFGIATTSLAGYFPSKRAAKIDPVEILRG